MRSTFPHTDPPVCRRIWKQTCKTTSRARPASGTHGAATLIPTPAVPVWAVLKGAVCILEATLTQRKNLQPWLYI